MCIILTIDNEKSEKKGGMRKMWWEFIRLLVMVILILCLIKWGLVWSQKRVNPFSSSTQFKIKEHLKLSPKNTLMIVSVGTRSFLLNVNENSVSLLSELNEKDLLSPVSSSFLKSEVSCEKEGIE